MSKPKPFAVIIFITPSDIASTKQGKSSYDRYIFNANSGEFILTHLANESDYDPIEVNFCSFLDDFSKETDKAKEKNKPKPFIDVIIPIHDIDFSITLGDIPTSVLFAFKQVDEKLKAIEVINRQIITSITSTQNRLINSSAPANDRVSTLYESRSYLYSTLMGMYRTSVDWFKETALCRIRQREQADQGFNRAA